MDSMPTETPAEAQTAAPRQDGREHRLQSSRKGWRRLLPPPFHATIPSVYLGLGSAALLGGLYLPDSSWYLPYLLLGMVFLLRFGIGLLRLTQRLAARRRRMA